MVGVDRENRMYLLDLWRGQTSSDVWIEAWCDLVKKWKPGFWAKEHGQIISSREAGKSLLFTQSGVECRFKLSENSASTIFKGRT
jgi:hypothetical protein